MSDVEDYEDIQRIANNDVVVLKMKGKHYGRSWIKRGGTGAFMMLARKWDRIENDVAKHAYDILTAIHENGMDRGDLLDDIQDLRRYLLLVESEYRCNTKYINAGQGAARTCPHVGCDLTLPHTHPTHGPYENTASGALESRGERFGGTEHK